MTAEVSTATGQTAAFQVLRRPTRRRIAGRRNWLGGAFAWLWLVVVMLPIYWIVITSVKTQANYFVINPLVPPTDPTMENYQLVLEFVGYFIKSVIVTVGAVAPAVLVSFMAAFAIVRGFGRFLGSVNSLFLMGSQSRSRRRSSPSTSSASACTCTTACWRSSVRRLRSQSRCPCSFCRTSSVTSELSSRCGRGKRQRAALADSAHRHAVAVDAVERCPLLPPPGPASTYSRVV
jgi:hypothetical protein